MDDFPLISSEPTPLLKKSMTRRWYSRVVVEGKITIPAVPAMLDEYATMCDNLFGAVGRNFSAEELAHVKTVLKDQLIQAYSFSPRSSIVISFDAPVGPTLHYQVEARWWTLAEAYDDWVSTRKPPLFGTEPDARVWALATATADPTTHPVLDIGAGTGRNAIALARRGHPVDAVEMAPKFVDILRSEAERESLDLRVIARDVFSTKDDLRQDYQLILLSEVVPDFRTTQQLRGLFELATHCLSPGGHLVFSAFLPRGQYVPDQAAREFGQQLYTGIFTHEEMSTEAAELPLELIADDSVYDYEKEHLPPGAWPPTSWYIDWISGLDLFCVTRDQRPIELRWLVYQKTHTNNRAALL